MIFLLLIPSVFAITYPTYYLSNYCDKDVSSIIRMGVTPYFANKAKKLTKDSYQVARIKAAEQEDLCDVVRNCSVFFRPPAGHSLLVTALAVDNGNDIGSLSVHIDNSPVWHWDDDNEFNKSLDFSQHSEVDGIVGIAVTVRTVTTVWRNFKVNIILTAFKIVNETEGWCRDGFHFNCGNSHCIRRAYECDGFDNCGNRGDETFCGLDDLSAGMLALGIIISLSFLSLVFWLDSRPDLVRRILNQPEEEQDPAVLFLASNWLAVHSWIRA